MRKGLIKSPLFVLYPFVAAGLALRLWHIGFQLVMFRDETTYAYQIKHILNGTIFQDATYYTFPPAFPLLAAPVALVTGNPEFAGRFISCLAGAGAAIPMYYLARDIFGARTAAVAGAVVALFPPLMSVGVMSEPTYSFFLALGLYFGNRAYSAGRAKTYLLFGLCMAAAYLSRPEGFFVFFASLFLMVAALIRKKAGAGRTAAVAGAALAGFLLLAGPYMLQLRSHFGAWEISGKTRINLAKARAAETLRHGADFEKRANSLYAELEKKKEGLGGNLAREMSDMLGRYPRNFAQEVRAFPQTAGLPVLFAAALGVLFVLTGNSPARKLLPAAAAMAPVFLIPAVFVLNRVLVPYLPVVLVFSAHGTAGLADAAEKRSGFYNKGWAGSGLTVIAAAVLLISTYGIIPRGDPMKGLDGDDYYRFMYDIRQVAEEARRSVVPPGSRIITRNNTFAYYAGGEYLEIPSVDIPELLAYARDNRADFVYYGLMEQSMRPQFMPLFFSGDMPLADPLGDGSVELVYAEGESLIYRFNFR